MLCIRKILKMSLWFLDNGQYLEIYFINFNEHHRAFLLPQKKRFLWLNKWLSLHLHLIPLYHYFRTETELIHHVIIPTEEWLLSLNWGFFSQRRTGDSEFMAILFKDKVEPSLVYFLMHFSKLCIRI